jgi:hypothetical protein
MTALPAILEKHPTARFALLTLTVRNCEVDDLRETIQKMNKGWKKLIQRKDWPAIGWIRSVEVTRGKDDSAHPHFHALLMLPSSYFRGQAYVSTSEWVQRWRESMRLDYDPICDIRQVKPKKSLDAVDDIAKKRSAAVVSAVSEVAKYATKTTDLLQAGPDWLRAFVREVRGLKFLTSGGTLKGILKAVKEDEAEDLVHVGDGEAEPDAGPKLRFGWRQTHSRYARKI